VLLVYSIAFVRDLGRAEGSGEEEGERLRLRWLRSSECLVLPETVRELEALRLSSREEDSLPCSERLLRFKGLMGVGPASMRSS
jgi:hypothetical protein